MISYWIQTYYPWTMCVYSLSKETLGEKIFLLRHVDNFALDCELAAGAEKYLENN